ARVVGEIAAADAVLLASPVYRGSFTGALKNLLDLVPVEALRDKPVGIVAMGATLHHYLGVDWHLRAVLAWFGALTLPTSVYLESAHFKDGALADAAARAGLLDLVSGLLGMAGAARRPLGPRPSPPAARRSGAPRDRRRRVAAPRGAGVPSGPARAQPRPVPPLLPDPARLAGRGLDPGGRPVVAGAAAHRLAAAPRADQHAAVRAGAPLLGGRRRRRRPPAQAPRAHREPGDVPLPGAGPRPAR